MVSLRPAVLFCFLLVFPLLTSLPGCINYPLDPGYEGPAARPQTLDRYYSKEDSYLGFTEELVNDQSAFFLKRIQLTSDFGETTISFFQRKQPSKELILVFPILGGGSYFSNYFAEYFARKGFDTAIVHRNNDFKKPENIRRIEEIFREGVVRDRIALDFFEREYGKEQFGSFGISRGAINAAVTAGVDERLQYNVLAMGGSDIVKIVRDSGQPGIKKFRKRVMDQEGMTKDEFYDFLGRTVKTDPKYVASYINAKNTLMFISLFDQEVPVEYGMKLRSEIGYPETVFLVSGHYTSIAFTGLASPLPPGTPFNIFPPDFVETESLAFYNRSFGRNRPIFREIPYMILQLPVKFFTTLSSILFH